ncbi:MAG TPA: RecQ family zinc-binding domain-containing protein, partial [Pyrinomonadaceae bacterium]
RAKLERMMLYGQSAACRWALLHEYFGEPPPEAPCGNCDNCLHPVAEQLGIKAAVEAAAPAPPPKKSKKKEQEFAKGDAVRLPKYGAATVQAVEDDKIIVKLPDGETKKFKKEFVK